MAITEAYSGTATITTTEFSCPNNSTTRTPITTDGIYQVFFDTSALLAGDQFEFVVYEKVTSAGTQRIVYQGYLTGAMAASYVMPSLILMHGWDVTIQKIAGTDRSISWSIRQVA